MKNKPFWLVFCQKPTETTKLKIDNNFISYVYETFHDATKQENVHARDWDVEYYLKVKLDTNKTFEDTNKTFEDTFDLFCTLNTFSTGGSISKFVMHMNVLEMLEYKKMFRKVSLKKGK